MVFRPSMRSRNAVRYLTARRWASDRKPVDLDRFRLEKRRKDPVILEAVGAELAQVIGSILGSAAGFSVTCVACGHSCDPSCFGKELARQVASVLGITFAELWRDRFVRGSSHPKAAFGVAWVGGVA
jgi:hypothetical protein